jgi:hypothetical protein
MNPLKFKADVEDEVSWLASQVAVEEVGSKICSI